MSTSAKIVEFERREVHLSGADGDTPYTVSGVALGSDDITVGQSGIKKLWPAEELKAAADTLEGTDLVEDHEESSRAVVGKVTKAGFKEGAGVIYEAELYDDELADKISNGLLEVSIKGYHEEVDSLEEDDETGALIVENIEFANLSIVPTGASPSNTIEMGEAEELSVAELSEFTAQLSEHVEAGDYVQWGENYGIVLSMPEDGEVEVDLYEESDGEYRPIGETEMVSVDSIEQWDVDEENVGPMEDDEMSNESDEEYEKLQETETHIVEFSGTTDSDWSKPALEDFDEDADLSTVADHFLVSVTGFPPENYTDLKLPVVEPNGDLNLNALQNAKARVNQVDGLSEDDMEDVVSMINSLANDNFDVDFEENAQQSESTDPETDGDGLTPELSASVRVLTGDDPWQVDKSMESNRDIVKSIKTMTESIEDKLSELDEPVAVEEEHYEDLQEKANQFEDMNSQLESLKERTDILDEVSRDKIEELQGSENPMVVEADEYEMLSDEAEQVKAVYAESLSEVYDAFDPEELTDRFSIDELREKYEDNFGSPEEELTANPRSGDPDEEELEQSNEEENLSEEESKAEELRGEMRSKILGGE